MDGFGASSWYVSPTFALFRVENWTRRQFSNHLIVTGSVGMISYSLALLLECVLSRFASILQYNLFHSPSSTFLKSTILNISQNLDNSTCQLEIPLGGFPSGDLTFLPATGNIPSILFYSLRKRSWRCIRFCHFPNLARFHSGGTTILLNCKHIDQIYSLMPSGPLYYATVGRWGSPAVSNTSENLHTYRKIAAYAEGYSKGPHKCERSHLPSRYFNFDGTNMQLGLFFLVLTMNHASQHGRRLFSTMNHCGGPDLEQYQGVKTCGKASNDLLNSGHARDLSDSWFCVVYRPRGAPMQFCLPYFNLISWVCLPCGSPSFL